MPTLQWWTRDEDVKAADGVPYRLLEEVPELGAGDPDTGNMLIQGDNLEALKALLPFYAGQVKCIYIDPPYNTQSAVSVHYDDSLEHSQWLALMYPRLLLLHEMLAEDGLMFVQIDDNEQAYLTVILDEIFGRRNRMNTVAVKMSEATGVKMSHATKRLPKMKETVLVYRKSLPPRINPPKVKVDQWNEEYKEIIEGVSKEELEVLKSLMQQDSTSSSDVCAANEIVQKAKIRSLADLKKERGLNQKKFEEFRWDNAWRIVQAVGAGSIKSAAINARQHGQEISALLSARKKLYLFKTNFNESSKDPRIRVIFADWYLTYNPGDFWPDIKTTGGVGKEGGVDFPNGKKPEQLIERILQLCTEDGDLVLDSFLGSGTTIAVAHKMKRKYIGIEMGGHAISHCRPRLISVIDGEQSGASESVKWSGGGGFRFFRLGPTVFDENGQVQPHIDFDLLAAHIWFSETNSPWVQTHANGTVVGTTGGEAIALLYNGILKDRSVNGGNVLTRATLALIKQDLPVGFTGPLLIYGERSILSKRTLEKENITFKQTPYDVKARS